VVYNIIVDASSQPIKQVLQPICKTIIGTVKNGITGVHILCICGKKMKDNKDRQRKLKT